MRVVQGWVGVLGALLAALAFAVPAQAAAPACDAPTAKSVRTGAELYVRVECSDGNVPAPYAELVGLPRHGTVREIGWGQFGYTSAPGYEGPDQFTVRSENADGAVELTQQITVDADHNEVPQCYEDAGQARAGVTLTLQLNCQDPEHDALSFTILDGPDHGTLGTWVNVNDPVDYTADSDYAGADAFTIRVNDGHGGVIDVTQPLTVTAATTNTAPQCGGTTTHGFSGVETTVDARCHDADGDPLTYTVVTPPGNGTLVARAFPGYYGYTPAAGFSGTDAFTLDVSDGIATTRVTQSVEISPEPPPHHPPACTAMTQNVTENQPTTMKLVCGAADNMPPEIDIEIVDAPAHGTLSAIAEDGTVTYTPVADYLGPDRFTFRARQGELVGEKVGASLLVVEAKPTEKPVHEEEKKPAQEQQRPVYTPPPITRDPEPRPDPEPVPPPPAPKPLSPTRIADLALPGTGVAPAEGVELGTAEAYVPTSASDGSLDVKTTPATTDVMAVVCPEVCSVTATTDLLLGGDAARAASRLRLRTQRLRLQPGRAGVVSMKLSRRARARLRRARRGVLVVRLEIRYANGRIARDTARFRIRAR